MMKISTKIFLLVFLISLFNSAFADNFQDRELFIKQFQKHIENDVLFQQNLEQYKITRKESFGRVFRQAQFGSNNNSAKYFDSLNAEEEKRFEKFLEHRTKVTIRELNKQIDRNNKLLKAGKTTEVDYIVDLRRYYTGTSNEFISQEKEDKLNVDLREIHEITKKAVYIVLSPIFPEQLSYAARTSPDYAKTDYRYSYYTNQFNENARRAFLERHSRYVAERSKLSNKENSGAVLNIESLMHYDPNHVFDGKKGAWRINFYDFLAFSKNINPETAAKVAKEIKDDKKYKGIAFKNDVTEMATSLTLYVDAIYWNWIEAYNGGILTKAMGKYRVQLNQLSESDKQDLLSKIRTETPGGYIAGKDNVTDHADVEEFLSRTLDFYTSRSANSSGIKLKIITTSDVNMPGGKNAMQLAEEATPPARTMVIGYHFCEVAGNVWLHWNVKYSTDLAKILPAGMMDTLWKQVGTRSAMDYYTKGGYLLKDHVLVPIRDIASNAWEYASEKAMLAGEMILELYTNGGRIPENWYKDGWLSFPGGPIVAGVFNCVLDDIVGLYDLARFLVIDIPVAVTDAVASIAMVLYDYATNEEYRNNVNTSLQTLANSSFELMRGIIQTIAFETGYQFKILGDITPEEYQRESILQKFATNLKSIDWYEVDAEVSSVMSVPFVYIGNKLEECYTRGSSTAQEKQYCSGYIAASVALLFTGVEELAIVSKAAKAADIAKVLTKTKFKEYIDKLVGVSRKGYKVVDEALISLLKRMPPWATELVSEVQRFGGKVVARGESLVLYCKNNVVELCTITGNKLSNVKNWIDENGIKIPYPSISIYIQPALSTGFGDLSSGIFKMVLKDGEFYIVKPKGNIIRTLHNLSRLPEGLITKIRSKNWPDNILEKLDSDLGIDEFNRAIVNNDELLDSWYDLATIGKKEKGVALGHAIRKNINFLNKYHSLSGEKRLALKKYLDEQKAFMGYKGEVNYTVTKYIEDVGDVTIHYDEFGFPNFTRYCPEPVEKFKYYGDDLAGTSADFRKANERLAQQFGFSKPYPKNANGDYVELVSGDYRWTPYSQNFYYKDIKQTWHHHQDGRTIYPVDSRIHSNSEGGFQHSGGDALIAPENVSAPDGLKGIFDSPIF